MRRLNGGGLNQRVRGSGVSLETLANLATLATLASNGASLVKAGAKVATNLANGVESVAGGVSGNGLRGRGLIEFLEKGIALADKAKSGVDKAVAFASSEDFNNVRNGLSGVMGVTGFKNPLSRTLYPGEKHGVVLSGDYKGSNYNFLGPGTRVRERMSRGDEAINDVDAVAQRQDLAYVRAKSNEDIRLADLEAIRGWENSKDDPLSAKAAIELFRAKILGETGLPLGAKIDPMAFVGSAAPIYREEIGGSGYPGDRLRAYAAGLRPRAQRRSRKK